MELRLEWGERVQSGWRGDWRVENGCYIELNLDFWL